MSSTKNKIVLITGCSKEGGLGYQTAEKLSVHGHKVVCTVRDLTKIPTRVNKNIQFKLLDLSNIKTIQKCVKEVIDEYGSIDTLVNNAAYGLIGPIESFSSEQLNAALITNITGPLSLIQAVLPSMKKKNKGHIIGISSIHAARVAHPLRAGYRGIKSALENMMESLASEIFQWNIKISLFSPGRLTRSVTKEYGSIELSPIDQQHYTELEKKLSTWYNENTPPKEDAAIVSEKLFSLIENPSSSFYYASNEINEQYLAKWRDSGKSEAQFDQLIKYYKNDIR